MLSGVAWHGVPRRLPFDPRSSTRPTCRRVHGGLREQRARRCAAAQGGVPQWRLRRRRQRPADAVAVASVLLRHRSAFGGGGACPPPRPPSRPPGRPAVATGRGGGPRPRRPSPAAHAHAQLRFTAAVVAEQRHVVAMRWVAVVLAARPEASVRDVIWEQGACPVRRHHHARVRGRGGQLVGVPGQPQPPAAARRRRAAEPG